MKKIIKIQEGILYLVRANAPATVTCMVGDVVTTIATADAGKDGQFLSSTALVEVECEGDCVVQEVFSAALSSSAGGGGSDYRMPLREKIIQDSYTEFKPEMLILDGNCASILPLNGGSFDFSLLDIVQQGDGVQEAELWVIAHTASSIQWSEDLIWANGQTAPPVMELHYRYVFALRKHESKIIINLAYKYLP